mmetsp:Transcript_20917/g.72240  ORF Transcript_20917/g.72240 Transcript_20917/m.72240 type:complete len:105 (-) Transcript_20917:957-1271(-)
MIVGPHEYFLEFQASSPRASPRTAAQGPRARPRVGGGATLFWSNALQRGPVRRLAQTALHLVCNDAALTFSTPPPLRGPHSPHQSGAPAADCAAASIAAACRYV